MKQTVENADPVAPTIKVGVTAAAAAAATKATIENADGMYPSQIVSVDAYLADLKAHGVVDPLDANLQLSEILKDARNAIKTTADPLIRADAKSIINYIQILRREARDRVRMTESAPKLTLELTKSCIQEALEWAIGLALAVGRLDERCYVRQFEPKVVHSNQSRRGAKKASATKTETAHNDYERINQAVAARIKKRGSRKQPSTTTIRHRIADELGFTYSKVMDAQRGGRKN